MNSLTPLSSTPVLPLCKATRSSSRPLVFLSSSCPPNPASSFRLHRRLPRASRTGVLCSSPSSSTAPAAADEGSDVEIVPFDDFTEKDWSFLDIDHVNTEKEVEEKTGRIIAGGAIEDSSKVVVCLPTDDFVDRIRAAHQCPLFVVHYSLYMLAGVKEKHDTVKCWQGDVVDLPERWAPFDALFLNYFPALPCSLDRLLDALVSRCSPGARIVLSYAQGRETVEQQRRRYPDMVTAELPDKESLEKIAADRSFHITEFVDEPTFYLAILKYKQ
ncbi:unnamed protein product [Victoria cruziana]